MPQRAAVPPHAPLRLPGSVTAATATSKHLLSTREQLSPELDPAWVVHGQNLYGRAPAWGQAFQIGSPSAKVRLPFVGAGVIQGHDLSGEGINARQVGTFVEVTAVAGQSQVVGLVGAAVLPGYHVLDMVRQFAVMLREPAVFIPFLRSAADESTRGRVHL